MSTLLMDTFLQNHKNKKNMCRFFTHLQREYREFLVVRASQYLDITKLKIIIFLRAFNIAFGRIANNSQKGRRRRILHKLFR